MSLWPPEPVRSAYAAWKWTVAWEWPDRATTWRLEPSDHRPALSARPNFVKVVRSGHYPTGLDEAARMHWAHDYLPVPAVLSSGSDGNIDWIVTAAIDGLDATRHPLFAEPERLVPILARGLATFHATAPVDTCPFDFRARTAIAHACRRVRDGNAKPTDLHPEYAHLTLDAALRELEQLAPASEDLVVCHGDYCFPNVLLDDDGTITGYVDLGELAVADRWCDVAIGAWSTTWNIGPGWQDLFFESYGIEPDDRRIRFYRLLYDLSS